MTVSTEVDHNEYTGNGVTTSFPYTFRIFKKSDLVVQVVDLNENIAELILDTDYTVTGAGGYTGGNVILSAALTSGYQISISRELPVTQETDLRNQGKFFAEVHEDAFDKLTMLIQQAISWLRLSLRKPSFVANYYDALGNYIRNLRDPSQPQDAATKNYVDTSLIDNTSAWQDADQILEDKINSNFVRTLRIPESFISELPPASSRAGKIPAFNSVGDLITILPQSGSASDVLIELANQGDKKIGSSYGGTVYSDYRKDIYVKHGDFSSGAEIKNRNEALLFSDGYWYVNLNGNLPLIVNPGSSPDTDWVCVGLLNGYDLSSPLNWGVEYGTTTEQKDKFQLQMDSLSTMGGGTIWLDGWVYLKDTVNVIVPDPIYVTNQANYFLKAPDNITIKSKRGYNAGFRVANGVVAANQHILYSKGFQVFSDAGRHVKNFRAEGFAIDYNGKNNLLPPLSVSDPQAMCAGFWFIQGQDIYIRNILHIECPGQQVVSIDYLVNRCSVDSNIFYHCGGTLVGNDNINDHSSIFCLASNYSVTNNIGIGHDGTSNTRLSNESTFIECHGQHASVYANRCYGYNCGAIFGAIRNDLFDVVHHSNQYYYVSYGINYDGANGKNFNLISHSNVIVLRNNKPSSGKYNAGHGHGIYQFADYDYPITNSIILKSYNNDFIQASIDPTWDGDNVGENVVFEGGKFTSLYIDDRANGLKSGIKFNYPSGNDIHIKMSMNSCGNNDSFVSFSTSLIQLQNVDPNFNADKIKRIEIDITLDSECKFTKSIYFQSDRIPISIESRIKSTHWLGLYGGNEPISSTEYRVDHDFTDVNTSLGLEYNCNNLYGKITAGENTSFIKTRGNSLAWIYRGFQDVYTMPTSPRPFGDRRGDMITPREFTVGQASVIVCVADGPDQSTVGTWKGAGAISA